MKPKILSIRIEHVTDESPDYSYLGEYKQNPPSSGFYVDRKEGKLYADNEPVAEVNCRFEQWDFQYITGFQHSPDSGKQTKGWAHVDDKGVFTAYLRQKYGVEGKTKKWGHSIRIANQFTKYNIKDWDKATTRQQKINVLEILYCCQDVSRLETLGHDWNYIGIIAKAEVQLTDKVQTIRSGGLWGVESDCPDYHKEVEKNELEDLAGELEAMGFGKRAIQYAMKNVERTDE